MTNIPSISASVVFQIEKKNGREMNFGNCSHLPVLQQLVVFELRRKQCPVNTKIPSAFTKGGCKVARPVCHMTMRCNAFIMKDVASPFWDEN